MRLVRQRTELDCGIATAAMLAGCGYDKALNHDPNPYSDQGLSVREFVTLVEKLSKRKASVSRAGYGERLIELHQDGGTLEYDRALALVIRPLDGRRHGHWIGWYNGCVYDPEESRKVKVERYDGRQMWRLIRTVRLY